MSQSKRGSLIEATSNVAVGYLVGVAANLTVLPMMGYPVSIYDGFIMSIAFTIISLVRSYALRRFFNKTELTCTNRSQT